MAYKYDHPPLLAPGRHLLSLQEIHDLCVGRFSGVARSHRERLYYSLEDFYQRLLVANITCDILVDGSFLTEKPEPEDVDIKVYIDVVAHDGLSDAQYILYSAITDGLNIPLIDSTSWVTYPLGHPDFGSALSPGNRGEDYGLEHSEKWLKGYVVMMLWETDVGVRIRS